MFRAVSPKPDLVAQEHEILARWAERRTFARLRAQNAGGERWSFLDGPITANNPMGVHHAWGRTYKDVFQRFQAMLGHDQRYQNGFDCQGLWVEVNVERDLGFTSKRDIEAYGIAEFVSLCKQRVLTYAARQTEQSIRLGMWMDWNDPHELRRLRDLLAEDPSQVTTIEGPDGPVTDTVEMLVGRLGMPDLGGSYFTFSNENNDLIWGFLAECHKRGWLYKGHDTMPWCARCGTGISQHEMTEGYQDREDPGLTDPAAARRPARRVPARLDDDALDADLERGRRGRSGPPVRPGPPGRRRVLARQGHPAARRSRARSRSSRNDREASSSAGATRARSTTCRPSGMRSRRARPTTPGRPTDIGSSPGTRSARTRARASSTSRPAAAPRTSRSARSSGCRSSPRSTSRGSTSTGSGRTADGTSGTWPSPIVERLRHQGRFYRLETIVHRYPHCWRCGTPLVFRLVDEWFISMGPVYDQARSELSAAEVEASLRYQIMDIVDGIRWIPGFGYERELDWLLNMHDWMISKKRYWGLALPIYDCQACGAFDVIGGRDELQARAIEGWAAFEGHTPHRPYVDAVRIACPSCGEPVGRIADVGNPWLDAGIVPFSTLHQREDPGYWAKWFPADFITESFPGQFRNWFYSMLAMSTVLRHERPFLTIFGYALLFGEDGRPMHKSWGNAIEFDEAADRMGVDVMRWMFSRARPDDNIRFGWHAADEARRELLVLWNVYAFLVTYARLADWSTATPATPPVAERAALDRWILSRLADLAARVEDRLRDYDTEAATRAIAESIDDLSTWYLRRSRRRFSRGDDATDRVAAFATLHAALVSLVRIMAPILPFLSESIYDNLVPTVTPDAPDSVHLTGWPTAELAALRDEPLEAAMATTRRAVELARTLRGNAGLKIRQPLARMWLALPGGELADRDELLGLIVDEVNVKAVELIGDESELVERRVKPLLPRIGRKYGDRIPAIMAATRAGEVDIHPDGSVAVAGLTLAPDEVEILASPRPGTAVAHDDGLVVVIDTTLTPELRAEGDARELQRAIQDLRRDAELALDDRIEVWLDPLPEAVAGHLETIAAATLADRIDAGVAPAGGSASEVELDGGTVRIVLRRAGGDG